METGWRGKKILPFYRVSSATLNNCTWIPFFYCTVLRCRPGAAEILHWQTFLYIQNTPIKLSLLVNFLFVFKRKGSPFWALAHKHKAYGAWECQTYNPAVIFMCIFSKRNVYANTAICLNQPSMCLL